MRFIDSNVLAYAFYDNQNREACRQMIKAGGIINTLNLAEAYNIIQSEVCTEYATRVVKSLLKSSISIVNVDINLIFETLKRTSRYERLKFIDLIHYTTALLHNCQEIASYDLDFDGLEIKRVA